MRKIVLSRRLLMITAVVIAVIMLFPVMALAQVDWQKAQTIDSDDSSTSSAPAIAMDGANAVAVWSQSDGENEHIFSNYSSDGGITWHTAQLVETDIEHNGIHPEAAISGLNVVAIWQQTYDSNHYGIYSNYSADGGATWQGEQLIDVPGNDSARPQVAISGSKVVAVWSLDDGSSERIGSNCSVNGGKTWQSVHLIDNAVDSVYLPQVVISGSNVVAVWNQGNGTNEKIYSNYSLDGGANWNPVAQSIETSGGNNTISPSIAMSGSTVAAAWSQFDGTNSRIFSNYSTDSGISWHTAQLIDDAASGGIEPEIAVSGSGVVAVWECYEGSLTKIFSNYSNDGGATWHSAGPVDAAIQTNGYYPQVALTDSNAVVVWSQWDSRGDGVLSSYSLDGGASWSQGKSLKKFSGHVAAYPYFHPQIAVSGSRVISVWSQYQGSSNAERVFSASGSLMHSAAVPAVSHSGSLAMILAFAGVICLAAIKGFRRTSRRTN
jgi:hypothetical protein